jgi:hypothetical protein
MSKWLSHLKAFYNDKKKTNSSYSYKTAMKDAAKTFKRITNKGTKKIRGLRRRFTQRKK